MKPENNADNIDQFTAQKLNDAQKYCYDTMQEVQSLNEPKLIELLRRVSSKAKDCCHQYEKLKDIQECNQPFSQIENEHTANGGNLLSENADILGGCVNKATELYKYSKDAIKFNTSYQNCLSTFKNTISTKMTKLIDDDLKRIKDLK